MAVALTGTANGASARQVTFDINDAFTDEFLSEQCGVEVVFAIAGHVNATVHYNQDGLVVSETDRQPNTRITQPAGRSARRSHRSGADRAR